MSEDWTEIASHQGTEARNPPLGLEPSIHATAALRDCRLGPYTAVGARTRMAESELGAYSYIVEDGEATYTTIGRFCSIARMVRLNPGNHPMWRAAQHHFLYRSASYGLGDDEVEFFAWRRAHRVMIGHDVWIGHGATVMPGVTVATGSVVGAGAVVTRDVPPYTITAGVPASPLRARFPPAIAERLLALAWWDWRRERLEAALLDFRALSVEAFLERHGG